MQLNRECTTKRSDRDRAIRLPGRSSAGPLAEKKMKNQEKGESNSFKVRTMMIVVFAISYGWIAPMGARGAVA